MSRSERVSRVEVVVIGDALLFVMWLAAVVGMRVPETYSIRTYTVAAIDVRGAEALSARLHALPGVREARVVAAESTAYLTVDSAGFDEHNVLNTIAGNGDLTWPRSTK